MLSTGDQEKACQLVTQIRSESLSRPVVLVGQDQFGFVTLNPVDRSNESLHTELRTVLNDVEITDDYSLRDVLNDLAVLSCWPGDLPVDVRDEDTEVAAL